MGIVHQAAIFVIRAKARIYLIIIGGGIAVIGREAIVIGRVVLQHRCEPKSRHTQLTEIIQVLANALHITTMSQRGLRAIVDIGVHAFYLVIIRATRRKAVGHQQIKHIADIEALSLLTLLLTGLQLEGFLRPDGSKLPSTERRFDF